MYRHDVRKLDSFNVELVTPALAKHLLQLWNREICAQPVPRLGVEG
ncbi:hypothetical protein M3J09_012082 [Ascochyta lentis]